VSLGTSTPVSYFHSDTMGVLKGYHGIKGIMNMTEVWVAVEKI